MFHKFPLFPIFHIFTYSIYSLCSLYSLNSLNSLYSLCSLYSYEHDFTRSYLLVFGYTRPYMAWPQDSKKYADTTSFAVTAVTTNLVVTVMLLQSCCYGQISRNVMARVVVKLQPSWSQHLSLFHIFQYWHNRVQQEKCKNG